MCYNLAARKPRMKNDNFTSCVVKYVPGFYIVGEKLCILGGYMFPIDHAVILLVVDT